MRPLLFVVHPFLLAALAMGFLFLQLTEVLPPMGGLGGPFLLALAVAYGFYLYAGTFSLWLLAGLLGSRRLARATPLIAWSVACLILASPFVISRIPKLANRDGLLGWTPSEAAATLVTTPGYAAFDWLEAS